MNNYVRSAAFEAQQALVAQGTTFKRSQLSEIIAALLGYGTYAALVIEEATPQLDYHIDDAEIIILNLPMGKARVDSLIGESSSLVVDACVKALKANANTIKVFTGMEDFYESHARQELVEAIYFSEDTASAMAESNAGYSEDPEFDYEDLRMSDLWTTVGDWTIEVDGTMTGEYDPDGDRAFNGDTLNCSGRLTYRKAGRAGLVLIESDGTAEHDDSWYDREFEADLEYQRFVESSPMPG